MRHMTHRAVLLIAALCSSLLLNVAQIPQKKLTNRDVIRMVRARLSEDVIIKSIETAQSPTFDVSPQGLITLKKAGVRDPIMQAMVSAQARGRTPTGPTLQETLEWLDNNFNFGNSSPAMDLVSPPNEKRFFYSTGQFKGCTVEWSNNESRIRDGATTVVSTELLTVDLATIDPDKVTIEDHKIEWIVEMRTTHDGQKIRSQLWMSARAAPDGQESSQDVVTNGAYFVVSDRQRGEKMRSAFQNAIALCGGKKSARF